MTQVRVYYWHYYFLHYLTQCAYLGFDTQTEILCHKPYYWHYFDIITLWHKSELTLVLVLVIVWLSWFWHTKITFCDAHHNLWRPSHNFVESFVCYSVTSWSSILEAEQGKKGNDMNQTQPVILWHKWEFTIDTIIFDISHSTWHSVLILVLIHKLT